jgi:hypothetical protein
MPLFYTGFSLQYGYPQSMISSTLTDETPWNHFILCILKAGWIAGSSSSLFAGCFSLYRNAFRHRAQIATICSSAAAWKWVQVHVDELSDTISTFNFFHNLNGSSFY